MTTDSACQVSPNATKMPYIIVEKKLDKNIDEKSIPSLCVASIFIPRGEVSMVNIIPSTTFRI